MASAFAAALTPFDGQKPDSRHLSPSALDHQRRSASAADANVLHAGPASSAAKRLGTPAGSMTVLGHYQPSHFSEFEEEPFLGAELDFSHLDHAASWHPPAFLAEASAGDGTPYPLTPAHTASVHTSTPRCEPRDTLPRAPIPNSISPHLLKEPVKPTPAVVRPSDLTPSHSCSSSNRASEDGLAPAPTAVNPQSPRLTVSVWGDNEDGAPFHPVERTLGDSLNTVRGGIHSAGDLISSAHSPDLWQAGDFATRRRGIDPDSRPPDEIPSVNQEAGRRKVQQRNSEVGKWLSENLDDASAPREAPADDIQAIEQLPDPDNDDDIPLGNETENRHVPGQTYYNEAGEGGPISNVDLDIIKSGRNWADAPVLHPIAAGTPGRNQPLSSQAAIERFERMCRDNDSMISRSATWGTRRRSLPGALDLDVHGVTSGNFLKKLSLGRGGGDKGNKSGGILSEICDLVRRQSAKRSRSRSRSGREDEAPCPDDEHQGKRESTPHLSPTSRTSSWNKKPTPSINTALASVAHNFAAIGTNHSRSGSVSGTTPLASPRNSLTNTLSVKHTLRRPRSRSEVPKSSAATAESHPNLVGMWKKSGGPPVPSLGKPSSVCAEDDDQDDDDEPYEEGDLEANPNIIDDITPDLAGFRQHITALNPGLDATRHGYLIDRIAHQQVNRYKALLNAKIEHLRLGTKCPSGSLCVSRGGSANVVEHRADRGIDPLSTATDMARDGSTVEGIINQDSFPQDIPTPPTERLPAEFECQLCYQRKKFQKPSDWTKHVHEDVQPFTCTWENCGDKKVFKRKADWVRHENEGHRHLEWWTCDVNECRHRCYRQNNFLQHLVREHKFPEPRIKTKAAVKRAGATGDLTWLKVEQCRAETSVLPQEEPCRFCGKVLSSWKKLRVHLAKHMEQIALPVLRLVAAEAKELTTDTVISPVQDPPPRFATHLVSQAAAAVQQCPDAPREQRFQPGFQQQQQQQQQQHIGYPGQGCFMSSVGQSQQQQMPMFYAPQYDAGMWQNTQQPALGDGRAEQDLLGMSDASRQPTDLFSVNSEVEPFPQPAGLGDGRAEQDLLGISDALAQPPNSELEPFPQLDALGLQEMGGQMGMVDPSTVYGSPFSGYESMSTYSRSPRQNAMRGSSKQCQEPTWDDWGLAGFH